MALFRRRRAAPSGPPRWATGSGAQIGEVPPSVVALVLESRLPPEVAACVDSAPDGSGPDWLDVADAIDDLARAGGILPGALYAMGAYGQLEGCFTMVDETAERAERATELLDLAVAHGVSPEELNGLRSWAKSLEESGEEFAQLDAANGSQDPATLHGLELADRAYALADSADPVDVRAGATLYARLAAESTGDEQQVLDAQLRQYLALYGIGDRHEALPRLTELAEASSVRLDTAHLLDSARSTLVVDAAVHEGPEAARAAWDRARRQSDRFPGPGFQERMVTELKGRHVPWVMGELVRLLRNRDRPDRDVRQALVVAEAESAER